MCVLCQCEQKEKKSLKKKFKMPIGGQLPIFNGECWLLRLLNIKSITHHSTYANTHQKKKKKKQKKNKPKRKTNKIVCTHTV